MVLCNNHQVIYELGNTMSSDTPEDKNITLLVEEALVQFSSAIKSQEEQNLQLGSKISHMISFGVIAIILLSMGVVYLTWSQQNDMNKMNEYMDGMTNNISIMSEAVVKMQISMNKAESGIKQLSHHAQSINVTLKQKEGLAGPLMNISNTINRLQKDAHGFDKSVGDINYNLSKINKQMKSLNRKLSFMVQDANRMPSPTNMFPF